MVREVQQARQALCSSRLGCFSWLQNPSVLSETDSLEAVCLVKNMTLLASKVQFDMKKVSVEQRAWYPDNLHSDLTKL